MADWDRIFEAAASAMVAVEISLNRLDPAIYEQVVPGLLSAHQNAASAPLYCMKFGQA
jgi:hypothetical protein